MNTYTALEFDSIRSQLAELSLSDAAKAKALSLRPSTDERECKARMRETTEAKHILEHHGNPPLTAMKELEKILTLVQKDAMLLPGQLEGVSQFLSACRRLKAYLKKAETPEGGIASYGGALDAIPALFEEIDRSIRDGRVNDDASPVLRSIRRKLENAHMAVKAKLESILRGKRDWFADSYVTMRAGRLVLPVKREYKNQVGGTVVESSNTGGTLFIEPAAVRKLQDEIALLQIEEENEIRRLLYTLTALVETALPALARNRECMETLDFIFAKAKLSAQMDAIPVPLTTDRRIVIRQGRHPLLDRQDCVPLDFTIGGDMRGVIITGPNTGGKTVALKTVGLLSLMAQSGLHLPVAEGSALCMNANVLCDIGDGQSISENLSTFSAHITSIIEILGNTTSESLVLLDELGSGTDPAEGMGLAVAILEELGRRGCLFVATTHYPEIKEYAAVTEGLCNARMAFDRESLQPLYRMEIGEAGESCALHIAARLGFPAHMLARAQTAAYGGVFAPDETQTEAAPPLPADAPRIRREAPKRELPAHALRFHVGDSVTVYPNKVVGIVFRQSDKMGMVGVQMRDMKRFVNHKQLQLLVPASELYPEDYDFSIIFDSVVNRKARHKMEKGHQPGLTIVHEEKPK